MMKTALNEYFSRKIDKNKFLVSTRCGTFILLNEKKYRALNNGEYIKDKKFVKQLIENKILMTEENTKDIINRIKLQYIQDKTILMNCIVNLTHRCNLRCIYCHANSKSPDSEDNDMNNETIDLCIDFILNLPHKNITIEFQGGEPLIAFDKIKYFLKEFEKKNKKYSKKLRVITIVTNLTLMTKSIAEYILKNNIRLSSSLDGPKELHNAQRRYLNGKGSYDEVIFWYNYFKKKEKLVGTMPTITAKSLKFGPKAIIDEYVKIGRNSVYLRQMNELGRGRKNNYLSPKKEDFADFLKQALDYCVFLFNEKKYLIAERTISTFIKNIFFPIKQYMCMRRPCGAAINQISITPNGDIYPCDIARSIPQLIIGNVKTTKFNEIVINTLDLRTQTQEFQPLCDTCAYNNFCGNCIVNAYAKYKSFIPKTPLYFECYVNKSILDYIFKKIDNKKYMNYFNAISKTEE